MSLIKTEDSKKWINALVALAAFLVGFITIRFVTQMGEWFDLEAKIGQFELFAQGVGVVAGLITFLVVIKNSKASTLLNEVYAELVKVIWPEKDSVVRATVGIVIGIVFLSGLFVGVDFIFRKILELLY